MDRRASAIEWLGLANLAAAALLVEVLSFRLCAAAVHLAAASLLALLVPASCALGAAVAGRLMRRLVRRGAVHMAHLTAVSGAATAAATVATSWASERVAQAAGEADVWAVVVPLTAWLLPALGCGAVLGLGLRRWATATGRFGAAVGLGSLCGCALLPLALWIGAPRAALGTALIHTLAALAFALSARPLRPRWTVLLTLPLAVGALLAGDLGAPWLRVRTDEGKRSHVARVAWTAGGALAVGRPSRGKTRFTIDRTAAGLLASANRGKRKPRFELEDLIYLVSGRDRGPVLVLGATGGRELQVPLAYGHPRVDALVANRELLEQVVLGGAAPAGAWLAREPRLHLSVGATSAQVAALPSDYQHVVVLAAARFSPTPPRLLPMAVRALTRNALAGYLGRLRDDGYLMLQVQWKMTRAVLATVLATAGLSPARTGQRLFVCADVDRGVAALVVGRRPLGVARLHKLTKRCKKARYQVVFPQENRGPRRGRAGAGADGPASIEPLATGVVLTDARPLGWASPWLGTMVRTVRATFGAPRHPARVSVPGSSEGHAKPAPSGRSVGRAATASSSRAASRRAARAKPRATAPPSDADRAAGVGLPALLAITAVVLLVWVLSPPRRDRAGPSTARWLVLALPSLGAAKALAIFALVDGLVVRLGGVAGWGLLLPMGFAGAAAGWLWCDVPTVRHRPWVGVLVGGLGLLPLLLAPRLGAQAQGASVAVSAGAGLLVFAMAALLSLPIGLAAAAVGRTRPELLGWLWAAQHVGWALGSALALLLVSLSSLGSLPVAALAACTLGALALVLGLRVLGGVRGAVSDHGSAA